MNFQELSEKVGFNPTFDTLTILFLMVAAFFYGISIGRKRMALILISTYLGYAIYQVIPFLDGIADRFSGLSALLAYIAAFGGTVLAVYYVLSGSNLKNLLTLRSGGIGSWWQIFAMALMQVGLSVTIVLSFFAENLKIEFTPITTLLFMGDISRCLWFVGPILFLGLFKKGTRDI